MLQRLKDEGVTQAEIAERYGVTRQAVTYWFKRAGLTEGRRLNHKDMIPWVLRPEDHGDMITRCLRWISMRGQGVALDGVAERQVAKLLAFLEDENKVIDYTREDGYAFVPRDPKRDAPGDPVRRPLEQ